MSDKKPHWRRPDDTSDELEVGDRIVAICRWTASYEAEAKPHVITLTIDEDGDGVDNEHQSLFLGDCERWMPESEFLRVFGLEVQQ